MDKLKFATIGCGRIAKKHMEALANNFEEAELVCVSDIILRNAEEKSALYNDYLQSKGYKKASIKLYQNYKEMLKNEKIDVVTIATESGYHPEIAIECLNAGIHVVVEKPMALSTADAEKMIEASRKNNKKLCVCHQNRFNTSIAMLRSAVEKNRFGKLVNGTARILWNRNMEYYNQAPWRGTWKLDGGTLMNQCIHNIDLLQWMMGGEVDSVYAQCGTFIRDIEAEDFGAIIIRFKNGAIGIVEGTACVYPKNLEETLSIFGEKGTVCIGGIAVNKIETWRFADGLDNEAEILKRQEGDPDSVYGFGHTPLFKDMIDSIKSDKEPLISGESGKVAMEIILAAYKSQKTGMPVKFPIGDFSTIDMIR
ncbi:glucose--fructose oxidoreductase precursor [Oxobacter pfennigii]|uniref:Glucose--fructose oxidoreductase n=1 Tax=Oxobacter pfennigii TaxID=36849 RepID=A0A0P8W9Q4_9CLOT|nr:Gfo/Idh/MocA family oxidoreductase [Oxobacter pfennigii]KPU45369.1 glucose--fructose oxidoreductase precursor [Oxobacter pfennigii]